MTSFKGKYDYMPRFLRKICHVSMKQEKIIFLQAYTSLKGRKKSENMNLLLKKCFLQALKTQKT